MDITQCNFDEKFPEIKHNLETCRFIGFDTEFTMISSDHLKHRLFDTNEKRYESFRTEINKVKMFQVGLTCFMYDRDRNMYKGTAYTFHLRTQHFQNIDQSFVLQASAVDFFRKNNFDFNKFIYDGIPYLNKFEEEEIKQLIENDDNLHFDMAMEAEIQKHCSQVSKWLTQSKDNTMYIPIEDPILRYILHTQFRLRFPEICTADSLGESKMMVLYRNKDVNGMRSIPKERLNKNLLNHLLGFTKVLNILQKLKKPIIGHNLSLDLMILHNQFIGPLPNKYTLYKQNILQTFSNIYDTKYISFYIKRSSRSDNIWKRNVLPDLYNFFYERLCEPQWNVAHVEPSGSFPETKTYHDAGWDSYVAGYCFVKLGHWVAYTNRGGHAITVGPTEILAVLAKFCNKINVIRGPAPYMDLAGDDPQAQLQLIQIRVLNEKKINIHKVTTLLSNIGTIDVKPIDNKSALVATGSKAILAKIINNFEGSSEYNVSMYDGAKRSLPKKVAFWSTAMITGGLLLYFLHRRVKQ